MKKPIWINVIGVLLLFSGVIGIISGSFDILGNAFIESVSNDPEIDAEIKESLKEVIEKTKDQYPSWYNTWKLFVGGANVIVSLLFVAAAILLMKVRSDAIKLTYIALGSSLLFSAIKAVIVAKSANAMMFIQLIYMPFGVIFDIVVLLTVILANKSIFAKNHEAI